MVKDYKSLYLKYKNKYIHAKKNLKGGSQSFDSKSDPFEVSALTINTGAESSNNSILLPPSPSRKEPTTPIPKVDFEPILNHIIERNMYVSYQKPVQFMFEKINYIEYEKNKFVTLFTSKKKSGVNDNYSYRYYYKIGDLEKNVDDYEEIPPLDVNKPTIFHIGMPGGPGYINYENSDSMPRKKFFINREEIIVGNQIIYLFVNENYRLFYFIEKNDSEFPYFVTEEHSTGKKESGFFIDNKGINNEELADPILNRRQEILKLKREQVKK